MKVKYNYGPDFIFVTSARGSEFPCRVEWVEHISYMGNELVDYFEFEIQDSCGLSRLEETTRLRILTVLN